MKKLFLFIFVGLLNAPLFPDYNGSLFDPVTGYLLYIRVYQPTDQICVQINSANHICWSTPVTNNNLLLQDGTSFFLEDSGELILE